MEAKMQIIKLASSKIREKGGIYRLRSNTKGGDD